MYYFLHKIKNRNICINFAFWNESWNILSIYSILFQFLTFVLLHIHAAGLKKERRWKKNFQFWVRAISISMASHLNYVVDWFPSLLVPFHLQRMKKRRRERISRRKLILKREKGQRRDLTYILVQIPIRNLKVI